MIIVVPVAENFTNDMFTLEYTAGKRLRLNVVSEAFTYGGRDTFIDEMNVQMESDSSGVTSVLVCPNKIGLSNDILSIESDDPALQGASITMQNLGQWSVVLNV
jgi:hypothetical protein